MKTRSQTQRQLDEQKEAPSSLPEKEKVETSDLSLEETTKSTPTDQQTGNKHEEEEGLLKESPKETVKRQVSRGRENLAIKEELQALKSSMRRLSYVPSVSPSAKNRSRGGEKFNNYPLPLKCSQLLFMFKHLQMVYHIRNTKSSFLTFADAKASIQKASGKTFSIRDLAKIKFVLPEILHWQYLEGNADTPASSRLVISLICPETKSGIVKDDIALYNILKERLVHHAKRAALIKKENDDLPEADLPDPSLVNLYSASKSLSGRGWSGSCSGYSSRSASSVKHRRTSKSLTPAKRVAASSRINTPTFCTPTRLTTVTEQETDMVGDTDDQGQRSPAGPHHRASIFSPCSDNKQLVRQNIKRRMLMSPSKVKERERNHALRNLVETLKDVHAVFRRFKTTKRPVKDIVETMKTTTKRKYTEEAAHLHIQLLLEYAPQFIKLEAGDTKDKDVLCIEKECDVQELKEMLKEIAEKRPKIEINETILDQQVATFDAFDVSNM